MNDLTRRFFRQLKVLEGPFIPFEIDASCPTPQEQFMNWFMEAVKLGVPEPHAMTLSTCDERGNPDARILILKDIDDAGWHFAISSSSPKGRQLRLHPQAALTFYWQPLGRQVRIRGSIVELDAAASAADFQQRPPGSRAGALVARQSDVLESSQDLDDALAEQRAVLAQDPNRSLPSWTVNVLSPTVVEFWQADEERRHARLRYSRVPGGWSKDRLWP